MLKCERITSQVGKNIIEHKWWNRVTEMWERPEKKSFDW